MQSIDLNICQDCRLILGNGEHGDCDGTCPSCTATTPKGWQAVPGDDDLGFNSHPCELCGQDLAGDRYRAHLLSN